MDDLRAGRFGFSVSVARDRDVETRFQSPRTKIIRNDKRKMMPAIDPARLFRSRSQAVAESRLSALFRELPLRVGFRHARRPASRPERRPNRIRPDRLTARKSVPYVGAAISSRPRRELPLRARGASQREAGCSSSTPAASRRSSPMPRARVLAVRGARITGELREASAGRVGSFQEGAAVEQRPRVCPN